MANHFIAINRGVAGTKISDWTFGTSSSASSDIELRIADVDGQSKVMTEKDIILALEMMIGIIGDRLFTTFPPL